MKKINEENNYIVTYENIYIYNNYTKVIIIIFLILFIFYILVILNKYN
jgi:hypothetical protein